MSAALISNFCNIAAFSAMTDHNVCFGCAYYGGDLHGCMYGEKDIPDDMPKLCEEDVEEDLSET